MVLGLFVRVLVVKEVYGGFVVIFGHDENQSKKKVNCLDPPHPAIVNLTHE
jgi:hypothetical protein